MIFHIVGVVGTAGGNGPVIEYRGAGFEGVSVEGRLTVCNLSMEAGARWHSGGSSSCDPNPWRRSQCVSLHRPLIDPNDLLIAGHLKGFSRVEGLRCEDWL